MLVVLTLSIAVINVTLGFVLAVACGHGPAVAMGEVQELRRALRRLLRLERPPH